LKKGIAMDRDSTRCVLEERAARWVIREYIRAAETYMPKMGKGRRGQKRLRAEWRRFHSFSERLADVQFWGKKFPNVAIRLKRRIWALWPWPYFLGTAFDPWLGLMG